MLLDGLSTGCPKKTFLRFASTDSNRFKALSSGLFWCQKKSLLIFLCRYRSRRAPESLGKVYACHYPNAQYKTSRKNLMSPIHSELMRLGPHFRDVSGWESPDWFRHQTGDDKHVSEASFYFPYDQLSFGKAWWFENWKREHTATRENVALFDMSFMTKFTVSGKDAGYILDRCSTAFVDGNIGETVYGRKFFGCCLLFFFVCRYTQWLDDGGKLQADLTVTKLSEEKFMVVATDTMHNHTQSWVRRRAQKEGREHVYIHDVTSSICQLNVHGPNARKLLQKVTDTDLGNEVFPFRMARTIEIGSARLLCVRITYVGELGYEL